MEVVSTLLVVVVEGMLGIGLALGCGLIGVVVVGLRLVLCEYLVSGFEKRAEGLSTICRCGCVRCSDGGGIDVAGSSGGAAAVDIDGGGVGACWVPEDWPGERLTEDEPGNL